MGIKIIQGASKAINARIKSVATGDPIDLTTYTEIRICISASGSDVVYKKRILTTGNISIGSFDILSVDVTDLVVGDLVAGAGIPVGSKITAIDPDLNKITIDQAATANTTGVNLTFGDLQILGDPILGKVTFTLQPTDTVAMAEDSYGVEAKLVNPSGTQYLQFAKTIDIMSKFC